MLRSCVVSLVLMAGAFAVLFSGAEPAAAQAPAITILQPKVTTVSSLGFQMQVGVSDFILDQANYGGVNVPNHGHIHYTVNGTLVGPTWLTVWNFGDLPLGASLIRAELRNNDHSPLAPPVFQEINVTAVRPSIIIVSPKVTSVSTLGFQMQVAVSGFVLDEPNYGGTNVPGQGHIHYTVDGSLVGPTTSTVFNFGPLTPGVHAIRAELRNNNHSALAPPVFHEVSVTAAAGPAIAMREPLANAAVSTIGFRVHVDVSNFVLDEPNYGGTNVAGQGHIHYMIDGALVLPTTLTTVDLGPLSAGAHTIRAELRNNDHSPLSPAAFDEFSVTATAPGVSASVSSATIQTGQAVVVSWTVTGFVLDSVAFGGPSEAGRGHVHVSVDGGSPSMTTGDALTIPSLAVGTHTIRVSLANNDHSALSPAVQDDVTVQVTAAPPAPAGMVEANVFYGTLVGLLVVIVALAALAIRRRRGGGEGPTEKKEL